MAKLNINYSYPFHPDYEFKTYMEKVNLDDERMRSISLGKGFIISEPQSTIKKDLKNPNGIFSTRYGQTLQDANPFEDRYKCECGHLKSALYHGIVCPLCNTKVKFVDDDFSYFGWICLKDPYYIIHPNLFKSISFLIGEKIIDNIIKPDIQKDKNGKDIEVPKPKDEPFFGIGILEFRERFEEIMNYYAKKAPNKKDYYEDIMQNKEKVFTQTIPVFTTYLRGFKVDGTMFKFEGINGIYNIITKINAVINRDNLKMFKKAKPKLQLLYDMHNKVMELYKEIELILSGKKGSIRNLFGGRWNFTSRDVIIPDPKLRINQVTMPYVAMVELMQQTIINILQKTHNISYSDAYKIWYKAKLEKNETVAQIIKGLIKAKGGLPVLINRNPTICYGGILRMNVVDITDSYTLGLPLQILPLLAADFDGDVLNVAYIINESFAAASAEVFDPRNAMYISRNDGKFNNDLNHTKDLIINANSMINLARKSYSQEQLAKIKRAKQYREQAVA